MNGIHEVRGSIPLGSTNIINDLRPHHSGRCCFKGELTANPAKNLISQGPSSLLRQRRDHVGVRVHCNADMSTSSSLVAAG
jgi:hypothetical protein